ncbi:MAG: sugar ABC transporter ATP-binding protein [Mesorhizobium sp.]|nr:MAG: sugar ABC transporter ATP-binding protein [Mesorhizobium sp.]
MRLEPRPMLIELTQIEKAFPGVKSLDLVDFSVAAGEVHGLVGENGAGKSTLMKVLSGNYRPDAGTIRYEGVERRWSDPGEALASGIHVIHQELMLFPERTVAENIFVTDPPRNRLRLVDRKEMERRAAAALDRLGHRIDPRRRIKSLSVADQQMVEIAKALSADVRVLVLDEPTAVISGHEAELLFKRVEHLREQGVGIVYISHRLEEIFRLADRVTVLKDGKLVGTVRTDKVTRDQLISMMVGRELADIYPQARDYRRPEKSVLSVRNMKVLPRVHDVSFDLYPGEILGVGGMVGSGRSELAHAIFGSGPADAGGVEVDGRPFDARTPARAIEAGVGFVTEDRKGEGVLILMDCARNITAPVLSSFTMHGVVDRGAEEAAAVEQIHRFRIAIPNVRSMVATLSGGNQQKVVLARWARVCRKILILDEPTRGVDVGAKVEIYKIVRELADAGIAILMISSELNELIGMSDRIVVMREGRTTGILDKAQISEAAVMKLATAESDGEARSA